MLAYVAGLLFGLPAVIALLWKALIRTQHRRQRDSMRRGNEIYNEWLNSDRRKKLR